jgi:hypothetical protein
VIEFPFKHLQEAYTLKKRPGVFLLGVDASFCVRVQRTVKEGGPEEASLTIKQFSQHDTHMHAQTREIFFLCDAIITNRGIHGEIERQLAELSLPHLRLRPDWRVYFMRIAFMAALRRC